MRSAAALNFRLLKPGQLRAARAASFRTTHHGGARLNRGCDDDLLKFTVFSPAWLPMRFGAVAAVVFGMALPLWAAPLDATSDARRRVAQAEARGDAHFRKAAKHYSASRQRWARIEKEAGERQAHDVARAAVAARTALAVLLRRPQLLPPATPPPPPPPLAARADAATPVELERLLGFVTTIERGFLAQQNRERRDDLLLFETLALLLRLAGEIHHVQADAEYAAALAVVERHVDSKVPAAAAVDAGAAWRDSSRVRLLYKLRRFDRAAAVLESESIDLDALDSKNVTRHLRVVFGLARFRGDLAAEGSALKELRRRGEKAEESTRLGARFRSFALGRKVDLVHAADTSLAVLQGFQLQPHDSRLLRHFAALCALELGEYSLAEEILAGGDLRAERDSWLRASMAARLGLARSRLGDDEGALIAFELARASTKELHPSTSFQAKLLLNEARAGLGLWKLEDAHRRAAAVLSLADVSAEYKVRARLLIANALYERSKEEPSLLADVRRTHDAAQRDLDTATNLASDVVAELRAALAIDRANAHRLEVLRLRGGAAIEERRRELWSEAIRLQDDALRQADAANLPRLASVAAGNLGELYLESGDIESAKSFVDWALERARQLGLFETEWRCHWYRARIASASGDEEGADAHYSAALDLVEGRRARIVDFGRKSGFLNDKSALYRDLVAREIRRGNAAKALTMAERAKARALVESMGWRHFPLHDQQERALLGRWMTAIARHERASQSRAPRLLGAAAKPLDLDAVRRELSEIKSELAKRVRPGSALAAIVNGDPADAQTIRNKLLPPAQTLVEYFALEDSLVVFVVNGVGVDVRRLGVSVTDVQRQTESFLRGGAADVAAARRLYDWLVAPVRQLMDQPRVVVVPYGPLHQLPFETLRDHKGSALIDAYEISYLPAASALRYVNKTRPCANKEKLRLLAVVDPATDYDRDGEPDLVPLPFARQEVQSFAWRFAERDVLAGNQAIESECVRRAGDYDVIHYACHGEFHASRPWESPLFLAAGDGEDAAADGRLRAGEIYGLDLRKSCLVTLSGCETGKSAVGRGDDPISLSTAFLHSGARALIVSLWRVEDEATSVLMNIFYRRWLEEGQTKSAALRDAKLEMAAGKFSHPRQWGAFILIGES